MDQKSLVTKIVRGDEPAESLEQLGATIRHKPPTIELTFPPGLPAVRVSLIDVARGLIQACDQRTRLAEWSAVITTSDIIEIEGEGTPDWDLFVDALTYASFGDPIPDWILERARVLAG